MTDSVIECRNLTHCYEGAADIQRPEFRGSARADPRTLVKTAPENHDHQHSERLSPTARRTVSDLRRGYPHDAARNPRPDRPADRGTRAVRLHDHRADRTVLCAVLSPLEPRRLLRTDGNAEGGAPAAHLAHVVRTAFAGGLRADSRPERRSARAATTSRWDWTPVTAACS